MASKDSWTNAHHWGHGETVPIICYMAYEIDNYKWNPACASRNKTNTKLVDWHDYLIKTSQGFQFVTVLHRLSMFYSKDLN